MVPITIKMSDIQKVIGDKQYSVPSPPITVIDDRSVDRLVKQSLSKKGLSPVPVPILGELKEKLAERKKKVDEFSKKEGNL